jgi:hypothetical protein
MQRQMRSGMPSFGTLRPQPDATDTDMDVYPPYNKPSSQIPLLPQTPVPIPQRVPDFVLYSHPSCPRSMELVGLLQFYQLSQILIQDVNTLSMKPPWLDGVPTLADTKIGLVYKGSDAITFIKNLVELQIKNRERQQQQMKQHQMQQQHQTQQQHQMQQQQMQQQQMQQQESQETRNNQIPRDMNQQLVQRRFSDIVQDTPKENIGTETKTSFFDDLFQSEDNTSTNSVSSALISNATKISLPDNSHRYASSGQPKVSENSINHYQTQRQSQIKKS